MVIKSLPSSSYIEQQNAVFVKKAFDYEKLLTVKISEIKGLHREISSIKRIISQKKNDESNLNDKMQVFKTRSENQIKEISTMNLKIKNLEQVIEKLGHEKEEKEMALQRKTRKYRSEIARAKRCKNCSQRSIKKIKGPGLMNDLNQIKEESLSNYSMSDSDNKEIDLNDYQNALDETKKLRGMYNSLQFKYVSSREQTNNYRIKKEMLADRNTKLRHQIKRLMEQSSFKK